MKLSLICLLFLFQGIFAFQEWDNFKAQFQKAYKNVVEENYRKHIFLKNLHIIDDHNRKYHQGLATFKMGVNKLTDTTREERSVLSKPTIHKPEAARVPSMTKPIPNEDVPESIDWRDYGVITPIADQAFCNACWAFAVVGTVEAHMGIYRNKTVSLSQQNLEDCVDPTFLCERQHMDLEALDKSYRYIIDNGIDTYESYPFMFSAVSPCGFTSENIGATIKDYGIIAEGDEEEMKRVVGTIGPVTVAITTNWDWDAYYPGGVYYHENCMEDGPDGMFNHAVVVVGYGTQDGQDYWLVKNSWGTWYGDQGYIKMARNRDNNCGIASIARYPIM